VVNFDLPFNPAKLNQRIARAHRIGQRETVFVVNLLCRNTVEEKLLRILREKQELFDDVFGPFMPSLGGSAVQGDEYPGGPRAEDISRAIHAMGSMIGNTVSHEFGHTLGLAYGWGPEDLFHNLIEPGQSHDNQIMDAGRYRPFDERAELNGKGPAVWTEENYEYLLEILPME